jgi:hypothetical protein
LDEIAPFFGDLDNIDGPTATGLPQRSTGPILKSPEAIEKLEELVLSVAQHHLQTIELFGAIIGFFIGVGQAIYFWLTYHPR